MDVKTLKQLKLLKTFPKENLNLYENSEIASCILISCKLNGILDILFHVTNFMTDLLIVILTYLHGNEHNPNQMVQVQHYPYCMCLQRKLSHYNFKLVKFVENFQSIKVYIHPLLISACQHIHLGMVESKCYHQPYIFTGQKLAYGYQVKAVPSIISHLPQCYGTEIRKKCKYNIYYMDKVRMESIMKLFFELHLEIIKYVIYLKNHDTAFHLLSDWNILYSTCKRYAELKQELLITMSEVETYIHKHQTKVFYFKSLFDFSYGSGFEFKDIHIEYFQLIVYRKFFEDRAKKHGDFYDEKRLNDLMIKL